MWLFHLNFFVTGMVFFLLLFYIFVYVLERTNRDLATCRTYNIAMRLVSATQGTMATLCGITIATSCNDLIKDRHWLVEPYVLLATGYLAYDTYATLLCYWLSTPAVQGLARHQVAWQYFKSDPAMIFHHVGLPAMFIPVVLYYRRGLGDGIIGYFMLIEAIIPFISLREILVQLYKTNTWLYAVNGACAVVVYTACRIALFPWIFWLYGRQRGVAWWQVPRHIPPVCSCGCAVFLLLYLYWWGKILATAWTEARQRWGGSGHVPHTNHDSWIPRIPATSKNHKKWI